MVNIATNPGFNGARPQFDCDPVAPFSFCRGAGESKNGPCFGHVFYEVLSTMKINVDKTVANDWSILCNPDVIEETGTPKEVAIFLFINESTKTSFVFDQTALSASIILRVTVI